MKLIKLMTVTALTVGAIFGTVLEPAKAISQTGNRGTGGRQETVILKYQFDVFSRSAEDDLIEDSEPEDPNTGVFLGAVQNFQIFLRDNNSDSNQVFDDFNTLIVGHPFPELQKEYGQDSDQPPKIIEDPLTLDLTAKLIKNQRIEYIFSEGESSEKQFNVSRIITLMIDADRARETLDSQPDDSRAIEIVNLFGDHMFLTNAVNSLEFIIDRELFGKINNITVNEEQAEDTSGSFEANIEPIDIHEYGFKNSLLVLGLLGAGWGIKRRLENNS